MALSDATRNRARIVGIIVAVNVLFYIVDGLVPQPKDYFGYLKVQVLAYGALADFVFFIVSLIRRHWLAAITFLFFAALFFWLGSGAT